MSLKKSPQPRQKTHKYGITGGIGSGKSYVCRSIEAAGYPVFYCDDEARRIIRTDADVRAALTALIGTSVYDEEGLPVKSVLSAYIRSGKEHADQVNAIERDKALAWVERNIKVPLTEPQKAGIASFCPYNIGPGKCFPSTFYKRLNAGDRKGACEAIRWWIKDGGRDCRIRSNNCYGQVSRRDQESALACWGIDR